MTYTYIYTYDCTKNTQRHLCRHPELRVMPQGFHAILALRASMPATDLDSKPPRSQHSAKL